MPLVAEKCVAPSTRIELLGTIIDTRDLTIALPEKKVRDVMNSVSSLITREK